MALSHTDVSDFSEKTADTALIHLVYTSSVSFKSRFSTSIFDEVEVHARNNNRRNGITGVLCYGRGYFLQCIEGEKANVIALQQSISSDKRHKDIQVLLIQKIDRRSFVDWRMRLLFLERWSWSPATKKQAAQLSPFLPFAPQSWTPERTEQFLQTIKTFDSPPHIKAAGITYNAMGNMVRHVAAPHQAFLVVQGFLTILLIVALLLLF